MFSIILQDLQYLSQILLRQCWLDEIAFWIHRQQNVEENGAMQLAMDLLLLGVQTKAGTRAPAGVSAARSVIKFECEFMATLQQGQALWAKQIAGTMPRAFALHRDAM